MSTVLVTGAAGFIGSNLAEELLAQGYNVIGLDNMSQGLLRNMEEFAAHPRFRFVEGDVRSPEIVDDLVRQSDCVVHLAAYKIPRYGNALDTLTVNTHGTRNVLRSAATRGVRMVFASTSDAYGRNPNVPFAEDHDFWMGPSNVRRWSYAISKIYDEQLCFAYQEERGLPMTIVRFFGGYGPRQNTTWWGGPQSVFIDAALNGEEMEIHGDGRQTRSFTYIADHVDGLIRCVEQDAAIGQVFNLGSVEEISIFDLAMLIWQMVNDDEPKYRFVSYRSFGKYEDVRRRVPDISKARALLGFEPRFSLSDGLRYTIAWQRALQAVKVS